MRHHFLDYYWTIESPIHKLDPALKLVLSVFALLAIVITPNGQFIDFILFAPFLIALLIFSKLPIGAILRRMAVILPLVFLIALSLPFISPGKPIFQFHFIVPLTITDAGLENFLSVLVKAVFAIWIMTLLTATTRFRDLITAMQRLKFPILFTSILGFIYRYIFLFTDEAERLSIARRSRSYGHKPFLAMKGFGWMISSLFIRSFERGERIYHTMCARGFNGTYMTMTKTKITTDQIIISILTFITIIIIKLAGYLYGK